MAPETEVETKTSRESIAEHELIDANAQVVDEEELADGIRYTLLENKQSFDWLASKATPAELTMLAIFGAKTLATNVASQVRNGKAKGNADEQMDAVKERFEIIRGGAWLDRAAERAVPKVDKDALATAICNVFVAEGKRTQAEIDAGYKAKIRQKLDDDPAYARKARQYPPVAVEYARVLGRSQTTVDDLLVA